jgi:poly-gamma-glutamate capsule biosynthesis protein CapA/YwtB (metallophosphatase superfamily)
MFGGNLLYEVLKRIGMVNAIKISFLGDICLNDEYQTLRCQNINPFSDLLPTLDQSDFVVGNLECTVFGDKGENHLKKPRVKTNSETLDFLKHLTIDLVSLSNNHIYDNLYGGLKKTLACLESNDIQYFGVIDKRLNKDYTQKIIEIEGIKFGFLGYVDLDTNPNLPENSEIDLPFFEIEKCKNDIQQMRSFVDHLIVLPHWGGHVERGEFPELRQQADAFKLIDAGADLIIGTHSHVVQPFEIYKGKYVFYSLGDFCFSNILFNNKIINVSTKKRKLGIIPIVSFYKDSYSVDIQTFEKNKLFLTLTRDFRKLEKLNFKFRFLSNFKFLWKLYYFRLKRIDPICDFISNPTMTLKQKLSSISFGKLVRFFRYNHYK